MKFLIGDILKEEEVTSVVLEHRPNIMNQKVHNGLLLWHCPIDNTPLFQFSAKMVAIVPGMVPSDLPVIHQCPRCKTKYLVVGII